MIQPKPFKVKCINCGWSKVIAPKSDLLMSNDIVDKCPKCGGKLENIELNMVEKIFYSSFKLK